MSFFSVAVQDIYIYIYGTPPKKKKELCSHHFCWYLQYFVSIFGCLLVLSFFGVPYIFFLFCARRLHDLFVHFGRNAVRMRSMHSECIPAQYQDQDPRFAQKSCEKSWKYQDPRSKIPTRLLAKILEIPRSKIQESCGNLGSWILVFPRFSTRLLCKSWILVLVLGRNAFSGILW